MNIAIYPGSFDPISNGHLDIIKRASLLVDKLYVLVSINPKKKYIFTNEERLELVKEACKDIKNVEVCLDDSLVLNFAKKVNANLLIRGLRNHKDFDAEMELYQFNHSINDKVETIFLFPSTKNLFLSSSSIKELVMFGTSIEDYVPECIEKKIYKTLKERLSNK